MDQNIEKKKKFERRNYFFFERKESAFNFINCFHINFNYFFISLNIYKETINSKISEKYIKAGIYLASKNEKKIKRAFRRNYSK